jgi:hypothetical protein
MKTKKKDTLDLLLTNMSLNEPMPICELIIKCGWYKVNSVTIGLFNQMYARSKKRLIQFDFERRNKFITKVKQDLPIINKPYTPPLNKEQYTYQDIAELTNRNLTTTQEKMRGYVPVRITKTGKRYFSKEQLQVFKDEN